MFAVRRQWRSWGRVAGIVGGLCCVALQSLSGEEPALAEYEVKAAYLYNFISFTEWPVTTDGELRLCVYGPDPFGAVLDTLQGKTVASRTLAVARVSSVELLDTCDAVFLARDVISNLPRILDSLHGRSVLTIADTPGATLQGVAINMRNADDRVVFDVNLGAVHAQGLNLSFRLLRLAEEVSR